MGRRAFSNGAARLPFDLRALEVFAALAEAGSVSGAARRVGMTQSAVSQTINELEARLGLILVDRAVRPPRLTPAGVLMRERAEALLEEARALVPSLLALQGRKLPAIRVGVPPSIAPALVPPLTALLDEIAEQSSIIGSFDAPDFIERQLDLVIDTGAYEALDGVERIELLREPYVVMLPPCYAGREKPSLAELARDLPLVRHGAHTTGGREIELHLRRIGVAPPRRQDFDSCSVMPGLVSAGQAWAITTPLFAATWHGQYESIVYAPMRPGGLSRRLRVVFRRQELGRAPQEIAALARRVLRETCLPWVARRIPWVVEDFVLAG